MRITKLALLALFLIACRGGGVRGDDDGDDAPGIDGPPPGGSVTIQQIQDPAMPIGTAVEVDNVVVTAIDIFGARTGDLWVQEPGGAEFSGIKVFGAPLDVVATLQIGDIVTITNAQKEEFACSENICGADFRDGLSITELEGAGGGAMTMIKISSGTPITPTVVDALAIEMLPTLAERDAEWEKWEGVLITATKMRQISAVTGFGDMADDQFNFDATGGVAVQSALADLGTDAVVGTCYQGVTGIGDFFFDYLLFPTATNNLVTGGTECAAQPIPTLATIAEVQAGTKTGLVEIKGVFVSAKAFAAAGQQPRSFWIASSPTAAANQGVFVFGNVAVAPTVVVGAKVDVVATVQEFNDDAMGGTLTELTQPTVTVLADPAVAVVPLARTAANLIDSTTGPTLESVLVTLTNVELTAIGNATNGFVASATQGGTAFKMGTDAVRFAAGAEGCYSTIIGLGTNMQAAASGATTKPNTLGFIPVTLGTKTAGACP